MVDVLAFPSARHIDFLRHGPTAVAHSFFRDPTRCEFFADVDASAELLKHLELDDTGERAARCHHLQRSGRRSCGNYGRDLGIRHHGERCRCRSIESDAGASGQASAENICGFPYLAIGSKRSDKRAQTGGQFEECAQAVVPTPAVRTVEISVRSLHDRQNATLSLQIAAVKKGIGARGSDLEDGVGNRRAAPEVCCRAVEVSVAAQQQTRGAVSVGAPRLRAEAVQNSEPAAAPCYREDIPVTVGPASGGHSVEVAVQPLNQSAGVRAIQATGCFAEFVYGLKRAARRKLIDGSISFPSGSRRAIKIAVGRLDQTAIAIGVRAVRTIRELAKVIDCGQPSSGRQFEDGSFIVRCSACDCRAVEITVPRLDQVRSGQLALGAGSGTESVQSVDDAAGRRHLE